MKAIYRILAFIGKEIHTIVVQPQLLLLLVAGPFVVLLAFGLGYRPTGPDLQTIVVQPPSDEPEQAVALYLGTVGPPLRVAEVTSDLTSALNRLQARQVDLVAVVPAHARETILEGQNVRLVFYHNAIDPTRIGYITAVVDGATSQINRAIVRQAVGEQQASAGDYEQVLADLRDALGQIRSALQENDRQRAQQLAQAVRVNSGLVASLWLLGADPLSGEPAPAADMARQARELDALLADPESQPDALDQSLARMQDDTDRMLEALRRTRRTSPDVFVAPLVWEVQGVSTYQPGYVAFHSPTVLALLVQHLGITLAALSVVDERTAGAIELFRAAPVRAAEVLVGKFAAYLLLIAATSVGLVGLLTYALRVPLLGDWRWLVAVMA
ncbi:MAG: ABC transporter permease subunit, partial [Anaerolineae bacterium]|nr:ABC transporter permease subunit [Anaerolineae bacterium]